VINALLLLDVDGVHNQVNAWTLQQVSAISSKSVPNVNLLKLAMLVKQVLFVFGVMIAALANLKEVLVSHLTLANLSVKNLHPVTNAVKFQDVGGVTILLNALISTLQTVSLLTHAILHQYRLRNVDLILVHLLEECS